MAKTQKVTVTLPVDAVDAIRAIVAEGRADSISGFVQHAVRISLDDITGWGAMLTEALDGSGGPMTNEEREWADQILGRSTPESVA